MKFLMMIFVFLTGCLSVPNKPSCYFDLPDESSGKCAYPIQGDDFVVDNSGQHNYTLDGHNWTLHDLVLHSFLVPPETEAAEEGFFLKWCHENPNSCDYSSAQQAVKKLQQPKAQLQSE